MESRSGLTLAELNAAALDAFVFQPVSKEMISYLAQAARGVIQCDPNMMPPPTPESRYLPPSPPRTPPPRQVRADDGGLPTLEEFISTLVVSSNVQVPTLMSTLVYLNRLKARLQPMAKGLRCTTHRIFLASLILAAKYLNDSSPKNKHWANYSVINTDAYSFGFSRTEVNLMEKQLLFLLDWDLRITEDDLYRELDFFLAPIRADIDDRQARRNAKRQAELRSKRQQAKAWLSAGSTAPVAAAYPSPPSSRGHSRSRSSRQTTPESIRDASTPGLSYCSSSSSSSGSSYASSSHSRQHSRATTPLSSELELANKDVAEPYLYVPDDHTLSSSLYESPVEVVLDTLPPQQHYLSVPQSHHKIAPQQAAAPTTKRAMKDVAPRLYLPYEVSPSDVQYLSHDASADTKSNKRMRTMWGRVFGGHSQSLQVR